MGVAGIFHTDELPAYGITQADVKQINKVMDIRENDAFILVADDEEKARNAMLEVQRRAKMAIEGVPRN